MLKRNHEFKFIYKLIMDKASLYERFGGDG